ncbi:phage BR0599 family protein [Ruixingdingia sedimenti]|uniref:Phage BR0599 family protein n=1 Tax=Ruixingdingia sedimenti TaxID=3073604 RepID=A0ABU1FAG7_9RHOB|nr:phage BR0599 family protein [Xinfangfangia sp. LG-4]MDR5653895.1 phage BR0599 family protein [Xinfangfangia sp. LG-4]
MTYASIESSVAEGRPYFLYQFVERDNVWRFTSRATAWTSTGSGGSEITWEPAAVAHGDVVQTSEIERGRLELTWPLSHPFARRFLAPLGNTPVTLTIFRGHEQVLGETVAHWKGRVVGAEVEGQRILLQAESIFSTLRRAGVRAKYQKLCRHALYGRGCELDIALYWLTGTVTAISGTGLSVTIPEAAAEPDGWYRGGVLRLGVQLGFITGHAGAVLTLSRPMPELAAALAAPEIDPDTGEPLPVLLDIAPGCDLRAATCAAKFGNLLNFGGFPEIPGRNPLGGGSIV